MKRQATENAWYKDGTRGRDGTPQETARTVALR